jgi:hypothetical protein
VRFEQSLAQLDRGAVDRLARRAEPELPLPRQLAPDRAAASFRPRGRGVVHHAETSAAIGHLPVNPANRPREQLNCMAKTGRERGQARFALSRPSRHVPSRQLLGALDILALRGRCVQTNIR